MATLSQHRLIYVADTNKRQTSQSVPQSYSFCTEMHDSSTAAAPDKRKNDSRYLFSSEETICWVGRLVKIQQTIVGASHLFFVDPGERKLNYGRRIYFIPCANTAHTYFFRQTNEQKKLIFRSFGSFSFVRNRSPSLKKNENMMRSRYSEYYFTQLNNQRRGSGGRARSCSGSGVLYVKKFTFLLEVTPQS